MGARVLLLEQETDHARTQYWGVMRTRVCLHITVATAPALASSAAAAKGTRFPYTATVQGRDISAGRVIFGDAAQGGVPGKDPAPGFGDHSPSETNYAVVAASDCDGTCAHRVSHTLSSNLTDVAISARVTLGAQTDPEDKQYGVCRIRRSAPSKSSTALVLCNALEQQP